jgi:RNA recognition motif-containing protein
VQDLFAECAVTHVRIIEDKVERKPKGFGYVEFATLDGLKKALDLSGSQFQGRNIKVTVAEPRECTYFIAPDCLQYLEHVYTLLKHDVNNAKFKTIALSP